MDGSHLTGVRPPVAVEEPAASAAGGSSRRAVWIASHPKSGNTWLRIFAHNLMHELDGEDDAVQGINKLGKWSATEVNHRGFVRRLGKPMQDASEAEIAATRRMVQADLVRDLRTASLHQNS